jgi:uncharacterized membrane protein YkgB
MTDKSEVIKIYKDKLPTDLQKRYEKISEERRRISYVGYILGLVISLFLIYYNIKLKKNKMNTWSIVCLVMAISFITNYFYYVLSPKTDWMLNHTNNSEQVKAWLQMYKTMQYNYHMGIVLGIIGVGVLALAFRMH